MPIRPENKKRYPKNWKEIVSRIRTRSGGRCECVGECGVDHILEPIMRLITITMSSPRCGAKNYEPHPITGSKVVLTVAHLDHTPENCSDENLKDMCQRCHNRYDAPTRRAGIKERRQAEEEKIQPKLL